METTECRDFDVVVVGAGPAGLAAAIAARQAGARVGLVEREARPGGILKQCIHDGFGLVRYQEKLAGPEYAQRFIDEAAGSGIETCLETFVTAIVPLAGPGVPRYALELQNARDGVFVWRCASLVLATGCRERTDRQVFIQGDRPAGIFTAGLAQYLINIQGLLPGKRCLILGSGDIGLIMARRLTLEGAAVLGVHEVKPEPSGLKRNIRQCLDDFGIPLHLSSTVTEVHGKDRVAAVTVARVDAAGQPLPGTEELVECDCLILSVGLIPENELASSLGVEIDPATRGPLVDQHCRTTAPGVFSCGNALHVNDLVDYVSESGETAGAAAAAEALARAATGGAPSPALAAPEAVRIAADPGFLTVVPQRLVPGPGPAVLYFRSRATLRSATVELRRDGELVFRKRYPVLRPPEMERIPLPGPLPAGALSLVLIPGDAP